MKCCLHWSAHCFIMLCALLLFALLLFALLFLLPPTPGFPDRLLQQLHTLGILDSAQIRLWGSHHQCP